MTDPPNSNGPSEAALNDACPDAAPGEEALPSSPMPDALIPDVSDADIDREVSEAMASMLPLGGGTVYEEITPSDAVAPGTELTGTVVGCSDDEVFLEFNAKCQGVLPRSQFGRKEAVDVGRRVDVTVERYNPDGDLLILNRKGATQRAAWTTLSVGTIVQGKVTGLIKGGLEVNLQGIRAFMPVSQVNPTPMKDISVLLNETVRCEVMEFNRRSKNVLVSRRKVIERELADAREALKSELEVGQTRKGVVRNITDFGAFVDLGGLEGLVHIRDLSWSSVDKVSDLVTPGQEVEVKVLKIDSQRERISLGLKQAQPDPWANVPDRYPVGTESKARVVRVASFGAFAELEPGVEGLIPISEMSWTRVNSASDAVSEGDMVDTVVIRVEPAKHRLALSMKRAQPDPWEGVLDSFCEQSVTTGRVTRLMDFGAFVEIAPGVEGLIHISELAEGRVKSCSSVVQVGDAVEARVLGVDKENRRISLSLKRAKELAEPVDKPSPEPVKPPKKRKKQLRGGLASHFEW